MGEIFAVLPQIIFPHSFNDLVKRRGKGSFVLRQSSLELERV